MKNHVHKFVLLACVFVALVFALGSCVTMADIDNLERAQEEYQATVDEKLDDFDKGDITEDELKAALKEAEKKRAEDIEKVKEDAQNRTGSLLTTDPTSLILTAGTAIAGAIFGTNRMRDRARAKRGEPTSKPV